MLRNHYYWHRSAIVDEAVAEAERGEFESLERTAAKLKGDYVPEQRRRTSPDGRRRRARRAAEEGEDPQQVEKKNHPDPERKEIGKPRKPRKPAVKADDSDSPLIDCKGCGCVHRDDAMCPW